MAAITFCCPKCSAEIEADEDVAGSMAQCPGCNSTLLVPMPGISSGKVIAGYEVLSKLGSGGMGEVWLARQTSMNRKVALKILSPALAADEDFVGRFIREVETAAKLEHPNIVTAFDAGTDGNINYLAMSYVDGALLEDILKLEKAMSEEDALRIIRGIAEGLDYAWTEFKILHRDIKPANIILDTRRNPKLLDMGISKSLSEDKGMTMTGMIVGTPHYMSPEQGRADEDIDCRSDIYSLGATLYHMVVGCVPYDATTAMGILAKHITEPLPSPKERNPKISDACAALIEIMMSKFPEKRQYDWAAVVRDIDLVLNGSPPATARPGVGDSMVMKSTKSQALSRRKVLNPPRKARYSERNKAFPRAESGRDAQAEHPTRTKPALILSAVIIPLVLVAIIYHLRSTSGSAQPGGTSNRQPPPAPVKSAAPAHQTREEIEARKLAAARAEWLKLEPMVAAALATPALIDQTVEATRKFASSHPGTEYAANAEAAIESLAAAAKEEAERQAQSAAKAAAEAAAKAAAEAAARAAAINDAWVKLANITNTMAQSGEFSSASLAMESYRGSFAKELAAKRAQAAAAYRQGQLVELK